MKEFHAIVPDKILAAAGTQNPEHASAVQCTPQAFRATQIRKRGKINKITIEKQRQKLKNVFICIVFKKLISLYVYCRYTKYVKIICHRKTECHVQ